MLILQKNKYNFICPLFSVFTLFYLILEYMSTNVRNFVFLVIFDIVLDIKLVESSWGVNTSSLWEKACKRLANIFRTRAATLFTVSKNGFTVTPFANSRCQSLLQSSSMGSHPLLMVDVKVYYSQQEWVHTLC